MQVFPALDSATEAALRASIERFGVLVAVVKDQNGNLLDGHHRSRIADELGVEYRVDVREVADEDEAREIARTLNADRRQLSAEQLREVVPAMRAEGHSVRATARALGVSKGSVQHAMESGVPISTPERVIGDDGKSYRASRPKPEPPDQTGRANGTRWKHKDEPFEASTDHKKNLAKGQRDRIELGLAEIRGICRGISEIDVYMAAAVSTTDEMNEWQKQAGRLAAELSAFRKRLTEVSRNAR